MLKKSILTSTVLILSTGFAMAGSSTPQPGGKDGRYARAPLTSSAGVQSDTDCSTSALHSTTASLLTSGSRDGRLKRVSCADALGAFAKELQKLPYTKR